MQLTDFCAAAARRRLATLFEPLLPARVWCGNGRPPAGNKECLHAVFYVLSRHRLADAARRLPLLQDRPAPPEALAATRHLPPSLGQLALQYERLHGINWDQVLLDGSKKPAKKGANRRGRLPSIVASAARPCT